MKIRPSSINDFFSCPQKWFKTFVKGERGPTHYRAAVGTAIHKGAEAVFKENIKQQDKKTFSMADATAQVVASFENSHSEGELDYCDESDKGKSIDQSVLGFKAFMTDLYPDLPIPLAVEKYLSKPINNPHVTEIGGTVDFIGKGFIADIKTSKRKITPHTVKNYIFQQSVYALLAKEEFTVDSAFIYGVTLLADRQEAYEIPQPLDVKLAEFAIKQIVKRVTIYNNQGDPDVLFPGNPLHILCSPKFCKHHKTCKFTASLDVAS